MSTQESEGSPFLDVAGAANHLGVNTAFIRRLILERRIRYYKVGKFVRFRPADLDAFVEAGRVEPADVASFHRLIHSNRGETRRAVGQR